MMNDKKGAVGYVYEEYGKASVSCVFENGSYDGFSPDEQEWLLSAGEVYLSYTAYEFKNVTQVGKDYRDGYWDFKLAL